MFRRFAALVATITCFPACYDPEPASPAATQQIGGPADDPNSSDCDDTCQACVDYCVVTLECSAEPPTADECAWNCIGWQELATQECSAAHREMIDCIGELDCAGWDDPTTCVAEIQGYHGECDDEAAAVVDESPALASR